LSKKSKQKKQHAMNTQPPSKVIFTFEAVRMLKDALQLVEMSLLQNVQPLPNLELATQTLEGLKTKLDNMLQCEQWERETPLDYNELHILYAAAHMHLVHLSLNKKENARVTPCLLLCKQFSRLIERVDKQNL